MSVSKAKQGSVAGVVGGYAPLDSELHVPVDYLPAGTLLATNNLASSHTYTQTSGTMADADAANMAVTFTAPASGRVLVRLTGTARMGSGAGAGDRVKWGVRESTTNLATGQYVLYTQATLAATMLNATSVAFLFTGISAGSHTYKWSIGAGGSGSGGVFVDTDNPALMEVWSA